MGLFGNRNSKKNKPAETAENKPAENSRHNADKSADADRSVRSARMKRSGSASSTGSTGSIGSTDSAGSNMSGVVATGEQDAAPVAVRTATAAPEKKDAPAAGDRAARRAARRERFADTFAEAKASRAEIAQLDAEIAANEREAFEITRRMADRIADRSSIARR